MKKQSKKLTFGKETLKTLNTDQLGVVVAGGAGGTWAAPAGAGGTWVADTAPGAGGTW